MPIRCALLYKGLGWEPVRMGFRDPREGFATFPTLKLDGELICGNWDITEYLEERFVDRPFLFGKGAGQSGHTFCSKS